MGAHTAPLVRVPPSYTMHPRSFLVLLLLLLHAIASSCASDSQVLLDFKKSISNNGALATWNDSITPCSGDKANWVGVFCLNGNIWGIRLENMGLNGVVDIESLKKLPYLRTISLMNNNLSGSLPDIKLIGALKSVYLSNNQFSGEIPKDAFGDMLSLKKLYLSHNQLTGNIPPSLTSLPKLMELRVEGNQFQGQIPDFKQKGLTVNVSNNALEGSIPESLSKLDLSSFQGNKGLCGQPMNNPCNSPPQNASDSDSSSTHKPSVLIIVIVVIAVILTLIAIGVVIFILKGRNRAPEESLEAGTASNMRKKDLDQLSETCSNHSGHSRKAENIKLTFVRDDRERFDMQDLLKASAEVLGSGYFGSSYKAALSSGHTMVVKRFKHLNNVGREEFQEHMRRLGRLRHPNLLPLVAYYYRKEEKLLVSDYVHNGSLAVRLHGAQGQSTLDWPTRLKIVKGLAKGFSYLYSELPSLITPHGHLKSSNVLLTESMEPLLTDYGLIPVVNQEHAQEVLVAYKSPEYSKNGRITKKTDVWSFGIFILEILTGRLPANFLQQGKADSDSDLASVVGMLIREERMSEIFDKEMGGSRNNEGEMMKLLKIGMSCCEGEMEKRMDMKEAVERIEEVRERDYDDDFYSAIDGDTKSSRGPSEDFTSIKVELS